MLKVYRLGIQNDLVDIKKLKEMNAKSYEVAVSIDQDNYYALFVLNVDSPTNNRSQL